MVDGVIPTPIPSPLPTLSIVLWLQEWSQRDLPVLHCGARAGPLTSLLCFLRAALGGSESGCVCAARVLSSACTLSSRSSLLTQDGQAGVTDLESITQTLSGPGNLCLALGNSLLILTPES